MTANNPVIGAGEFGSLRVDLSSLIDTRAIIQANSGGGKSWLMRLLAERAASKVQIVVLDPEGEFATLREKFDFALVGRGGEIAAETRTAALLARKLTEHHISTIIDLYDLDLSEKRAFVRLFIESLLSVPRAHWHPLILMLDEAHKFCPEKGDTDSSAAVINLMDSGRKRGFAGVIATQRLSKLHKDAAAEANNVFIGRTWLDLDQERAGDLLGMKKADRIQLRDLDPGEFFAFGPALSYRGVCRFKSAVVTTTHPKSGQRHAMTIPKATDAIKQIVKSIGDLPAQAEEESSVLQTAQRRVIELEREMRARPVQVQPKVEHVIERVEISVFKDGEVGRLEAAIKNAGEICNQLAGAITPLISALTETTHEVSTQLRAVVAHQSAPVRTIAKRAEPVEAQSATLPVGEKAILSATAQYPEGVTREQLTVLTGYKRSSRDAYLQRLRNRGYVDDRSRLITATPEGVAALGADYRPLPIGRELREYWLARLPRGEREIFAVVIEHYPRAIPKSELETLTPYKRSSRDAYIQRLRARLLIDDDRGAIKASETLFAE